jgi:hypothetical protein
LAGIRSPIISHVEISSIRPAAGNVLHLCFKPLQRT